MNRRGNVTRSDQPRRGDARILHLSSSMSRACDAFFQRRGIETGGGFAEVMKTEIQKARNERRRFDKADSIAQELEKGWWA